MYSRLKKSFSHDLCWVEFSDDFLWREVGGGAHDALPEALLPDDAGVAKITEFYLVGPEFRIRSGIDRIRIGNSVYT